MHIVHATVRLVLHHLGLHLLIPSGECSQRVFGAFSIFARSLLARVWRTCHLAASLRTHNPHLPLIICSAVDTEVNTQADSVFNWARTDSFYGFSQEKPAPTLSSLRLFLNVHTSAAATDDDWAKIRDWQMFWLSWQTDKAASGRIYRRIYFCASLMLHKVRSHCAETGPWIQHYDTMAQQYNNICNNVSLCSSFPLVALLIIEKVNWKLIHFHFLGFQIHDCLGTQTVHQSLMLFANKWLCCFKRGPTKHTAQSKRNLGTSPQRASSCSTK